MKDFVLSLVQALVDNPDAVTVKETDHGNSYLTLTVTVAPDDMGKIIGKEGRTIKAIRDLARIVAIKTGVRFNLTLAE